MKYFLPIEQPLARRYAMNARIIVNNSFSQIQGLTDEQFAEVRKLLSYKMDEQAAYFSGAYKARTKYLIDAKGSFPTGLLARVTAWARGIIIEDRRLKPLKRRLDMTLNTAPPSPYESQHKAVAACIRSHRGGVVMPTGTGKSLVIAMVAQAMGVKTLVVVPTLELKNQLRASLKARFKNVSWITVENIDSSALNQQKDYDCLIIDECHHSATKTYQKLNKTVWAGIYYRFFFTATYFRNQENEHLLFESICGSPIYELSYKKAIEKKYIVPVEAYYYDVKKAKTSGYTWAEVYSDLIVHNEHRNYLLGNLLLRLNLQSLPTLCLVKEIAHGRILARLTGLPFVSGQDEGSRSLIGEFNTGKIKVLIGTTGILGEGIDTKPAEYIIVAGLGKAKSAFLQQIGRGVRTYPDKESCKIILFKDTSHKFTLRHFNAQVKILKDVLNIKCNKLTENKA
jgi:superfamily II DNA or RNA helicase